MFAFTVIRPNRPKLSSVCLHFTAVLVRSPEGTFEVETSVIRATQADAVNTPRRSVGAGRGRDSSLGGQWRVVRHYLRPGTLHDALDKLLQRLRAAPAPAAVDPRLWDNFIRKFEKAISVQLTQEHKEVEVNKATDKSGTIEDTHLESKTVTTDNSLKESKDVKSNEKIDKTSDKGDGVVLSMGAEVKDLTMEGLLQGLRRKKDLHFGHISQPTWKAANKPVVNKSSIHSRTAYVVSALVAAESAACLAKRAEDFIHHINQYPEARDYAIKEGAVRALLRVQNRLQSDSEPIAKEVNGIVNEALALAGWSRAPRGAGPAVLSLDGGGVRGLIAIEVLRHLERLTGRPVRDLFDYIIGVSTGAIIAAVIGSGVGTLETAHNMYRTLSKEMFGNTSVIGGTSRLVWTHSYYDTALWEKMLQDNLGDLTLTQCNRKDNPKMALVSCVVNSGRLSPFLFRTYAAGWRVRGARGTAAARVWHAVRASAAAPTYFDEFRLHGLLHQDGGIMVNNPTGVGLHEARLVYGAAELRRATVVSLGTGQLLAPRGPGARGTSWRDKFNKILDSATDTEGVHLLLNDLLPPGSYFRLNPPLRAPCSMDEIDDHKLQGMVDDTQAYIRRNQHKFEQVAARLTRPRSLAQRAADELRRRAILLGLTRTH